ncbi:MAG: Gfo/Idh/MocA family oxidoreductase, partial [bacterium]|nr:Gfo/Idh/MocA family oxidoreductase [bacterium]
MPVRFGIIGCSRVAKRRFLPALASSGAAELVNVGSRDQDKARRYAEEFKSKRWGSYESVLSDKEVEAVYISTPPLSHAEWVLKAAAAGKHVICEKPAFPLYSTAQEVVMECLNAGVRLMENYAFLYHPQHAVAYGLLEAIGGLQGLEAQFTYPTPSEGDIRLDPLLGGGVFLDSFGYLIATALYYFDKLPESVVCERTFDLKKNIDTKVSVTLSFDDGRKTDGMAAMGEEYVSRYILLGTRGTITVNRAFSVDPEMPTEVVARGERGE